MEQPRKFKTYVYEELKWLLLFVFCIFAWSLTDGILTGGSIGFPFIFLGIGVVAIVAGRIDWGNKEEDKIRRNS